MPGAVHPTLAPYLSRLEGAPGSSSSLALPGHWAKARKLTLLYHEWAKGSARAGGFSWVMLALCVHVGNDVYSSKVGVVRLCRGCVEVVF